MSQRAVVLLVEDNDDDIVLVQRAFDSANVALVLKVVRTGMDAIEYFTRDGKYSNRDEFPLPDLVLLDLKMPGLDGFEVLRWIRGNPDLKALRVVVLTHSRDLRDVTSAYQLGADSFFMKDVDFQNSKEMMCLLANQWLTKARPPPISMPPQLNPKPPEGPPGALD